MVSSKAETVEQYLKELPEDRREPIETVRQVVLDNLPEGYEEGMLYGMICYYIPLDEYPDTYNGQPLGVAALASQKNYMSLYLSAIFSVPHLENNFFEGYKASGKKMDVGKSCVRFKSVEDLPLDVVAETIAAIPPDMCIGIYEEGRKQFKGG